MTRPRLLPILFALPIWHGLVLGQQAPLPATNLGNALARFAALQRDEGRLVGAGVDYRARFDRHGVEFAPALGEHAPIEYPVTLRGVSFGRGTADRALPPVEPVHAGQVVTFARGGVAEIYEVRPQGLKQSFVFHERPTGQGDLVVAVQVATELALEKQDGDAVVFGNDFGGVRIDTVLGIDALGNTCKGSLAFAGDQLQLRLPAAFVDQAALPLVLDPMFGAVIPANSTGRNLDPQVAYDAGLGQYLIVWWRRLSASTGDIYGQFVHRATVGGNDLSGSSVVIRSGANSQRARLADCSVRNAFLVGWQDSVTLVPLPTHRDLFLRAVTPTTLGPLLPLAFSANDEQGLELAGNVTESSSTMHAAWLSNGDVILNTVTMSTPLGLGMGTAATVSSTGTNTAVCLPRSGGAANRVMLAWLTDSDSILMRTYVGTTMVGASSSLPGAQNFSGFALDGDGENWFMAAQVFEPGSTTLHDLRAVMHGWNVSTNTHQLQYVGPISTVTGVQEFRPTVALSGRNAVVAWTQGTTTQSLHLRTYSQGLCLPCESTITVHTGTSGQQLVARMASQASGGETRSTADDALLVWQSDTGTNSALRAQRWTPADGITTTVAPGCGGLAATAVDECSNHQGGGHQAMLRGAPVGSSSWLVLGFSRQDITGCGACVLVPELDSAFVYGPISTDVLGNAEWSIPLIGGSQLLGRTYYQQWVVQDVITPGCPAFQFDLSNALQVTIQ